MDSAGEKKHYLLVIVLDICTNTYTEQEDENMLCWKFQSIFTYVPHSSAASDSRKTNPHSSIIFPTFTFS